MSIDGTVEATIKYLDGVGCTGDDLSAEFDDFCFDSVFVQLTNQSTPRTPGYVVTINDAVHIVPLGRSWLDATSVPADAVIGVYRDLADGVRAFYANHVYRKPVGCGTAGLSTRLIDHCYGVRAEVSSNASANQRWVAVRGQTAQPLAWLKSNATAVGQVAGLSEGETVTFQLLVGPDDYAEFATHVYRRPAACSGPFQTTVSLVDSCDGTAVTITSLGDIREYFIDAGGVRIPVLVDLGASRTEHVHGSTVGVFRGGPVEGDIDRTIVVHAYGKPAGCTDLPVTGRAVASIVGSGLIAVLLGLAMLLLVRRRVPR
ncbi:hypothetical protein Rhe02_63750 [Rhizocola hellebori]|uniref:Uncharacterized protein n=1 Tax=Rhizocola hellebori TaxID=1392758 RepID=A0A8J3VJT9_9ACTN|nr:hypothetical protein [Rhizocola hellebori]GIH08308.1 hypothetical protein Rhe02_63750 [Rhizocola hellebori]